MYIQPFTTVVDWPEIGCFMEVSTMFYICRYCVFTWDGRCAAEPTYSSVLACGYCSHYQNYHKSLTFFSLKKEANSCDITAADSKTRRDFFDPFKRLSVVWNKIMLSPSANLPVGEKKEKRFSLSNHFNDNKLLLKILIMVILILKIFSIFVEPAQSAGEAYLQLGKVCWGVYAKS